jgi:hypothetical protein
MRINTSFGSYYLQFEHDEAYESYKYAKAYYKGELVEVELPVGPVLETNAAFVYDDDGSTGNLISRRPAGFGVAVRNPKDAPNREMGRRLALERALDQMDLTKSQRREFWNQYFGRSEKYANMVNNGKKRAA